MNGLDRLKPVSEMMTADVRTRGTMSYFDHVKGERHYLSVEEYRALIADVNLIEQVPEEIQVNFEVAKNLFLYTFHVYRFGVVSTVQGYQTLEYALRERAKRAGKSADRLMLADLLNLAIEEGWLDDSAFAGIPDFRARGKNGYSRILATTIPRMRNTLAHGSFNLFEPRRALKQLRICGAAINCIFEG